MFIKVKIKKVKIYIHNLFILPDKKSLKQKNHLIYLVYKLSCHDYLEKIISRSKQFLVETLAHKYVFLKYNCTLQTSRVFKKDSSGRSRDFNLVIKQGLFHFKRSKDRKISKHINIFQLLLLINKNSYNYRILKINSSSLQITSSQITAVTFFIIQ